MHLSYVNDVLTQVSDLSIELDFLQYNLHEQDRMMSKSGLAKELCVTPSNWTST